MLAADRVRQFLKDHRAAMVGASPARPEALGDAAAEEAAFNYTFDVEREMAEWAPIASGGTAAPGEHPVRFIDGSHVGEPVACLRSPKGHPIPLHLAQVGAIALKLEGKSFTREHHEVKSVLGLVNAHLDEEALKQFEADLANHPELKLEALFARKPQDKSPFDYEAMRVQAYARCQLEMLKLERDALRTNRDDATLVDGQLGGRIGEDEASKMNALLVGLVKAPTPAPLHDRGWNALHDLKAGERTPYFKDSRQTAGKVTEAPLACWYLRLAGGPRLSPTWGVVRVDVPWVHLERHASEPERTAFANRLSHWLVGARCTAESYARMPISLEPIVRAEAALKPLFLPTSVLVNRFYHQTGIRP